ncbi:MAG: GTP-binding protein [bacterium]|nr:GTP-binding protein [bacterium]
MFKKKICMLGSFAVGKTSLVRRFVHSIFSEKYHTTIGVKIDRKTLSAGGREVNLLLWDIHGEDDFQKVKPSYLMGSSGYFLVVDGTRYNTLETVLSLQKLAQETLGDVPFIVLFNKADISDQWEIDAETEASLTNSGWRVMKTSAKNGSGVEEAFLELAAKMAEQ